MGPQPRGHRHAQQRRRAAIDEPRDLYAKLRAELGKVIVGQQATVERLAVCLFARGHALLMGVPGLAKTLLVRKLTETMSLRFSRIQFTPDLIPMDITGTDILQDAAGGRREFEFVCQLADRIALEIALRFALTDCPKKQPLASCCPARG